MGATRKRSGYPPRSGGVPAGDKRLRLERLRARIVHDLYLKEWREVWFFPALNGVRGWQGTQPIMFVGLNPSTGRFPSRADRLLYSQLRQQGFANAHLTDAIKERLPGPNVRPVERDAARMRTHQRYLLDEIRIVRPRLIVAMGGQACQILTTWLPANAPLTQIPHYAARFPSRKTRRRFGGEMARIRREYGDT